MSLARLLSPVVVSILCFSNLAAAQKKIEFVDPFIGTGGHGHTHPSAVAPFGMIQAGPDTRISGWDSASGYHYGDPTIIGFTHTHLSGTGAIDRLDLLLMPTLGGAKFFRGKESNSLSGYRSSYTNEYASPGYYSVDLTDDDIAVEIAASTRAAIHSYRFNKSQFKDRRLLIDLQHRDDANVVDNEIKVVSPTRLVGVRKTNNWARNQVVYFSIEFNQPIISVDYEYKKAKELKASLNFGNTIKTLKAKVAISAVDSDGAFLNAQKEIPHWSVSRLKEETEAKWEKKLSKIDVTGDATKKKIFYTAFYHSLLAPNYYQDVDGRYRGMDQKIHTSDKPYFTIYSLWDTYRALHPFFNIVDPKFNGQLISSLLTKYQQYGRMPEWELENFDTRIMIGYHGASVIADAYAKGVRNFDRKLALEAMLNAASEDKKELNDYRNIGYVAHDYRSSGYRESASMTLEYSYDDWTIAKFVKDMIKEGELVESERNLALIDTYTKRSKNYLNLFDQETGFFRPRFKDGSFLTPFDPKMLSHRNNGFTEANAWQYLWYVPHDVEKLVELLGGEESFASKLDELFKTKINGKAPDVTGLIGQYAHGNEPGHHIAYLYNYVGKPWKTQYWIRRIMKQMYKAEPNGLAGNEDCGQMSAWYLMNAMGLYSVNPGEKYYQLGSPIFDEIALKLESGQTLEIMSHNNSDENVYVERVLFNGHELEGMKISHDELSRGGRLEFFMTSSH